MTRMMDNVSHALHVFLNQVDFERLLVALSGAISLEEGVGCEIWGQSHPTQHSVDQLPNSEPVNSELIHFSEGMEEVKIGDADGAILNPHAQGVDSHTKWLFDEYMAAARKRQTLEADVRNCLVSNLHFNHDYDLTELEDIFKLKKRILKGIIKDLSPVSEAQLYRKQE